MGAVGCQFGKRYCAYARRNEKDKWSDWAQSDDKSQAFEFVESIRFYGYFAKLVDRETKEVLIID
jgi:hypothetical protein